MNGLGSFKTEGLSLHTEFCVSQRRGQLDAGWRSPHSTEDTEPPRGSSSTSQQRHPGWKDGTAGAPGRLRQWSVQLLMSGS